MKRELRVKFVKPEPSENSEDEVFADDIKWQLISDTVKDCFFSIAVTAVVSVASYIVLDTARQVIIINQTKEGN